MKTRIGVFPTDNFESKLRIYTNRNNSIQPLHYPFERLSLILHVARRSDYNPNQIYFHCAT